MNVVEIVTAVVAGTLILVVVVELLLAYRAVLNANKAEYRRKERDREKAAIRALYGEVAEIRNELDFFGKWLTEIEARLNDNAANDTKH